MKKFIALSLILSVLVISSFAQKIPSRPDGPPPPPPPHHGKKGERNPIPFKDLELTDAQRDAFRKQRDAFKQRMDALKKEEDMTVRDWKARMENLRKEHRAAMENILTSEQKTKMEELRRREGDRRLSQMKQRLQLSDDQTEQLKNIQDATQKRMKAIRADDGLSREQKKESLRKLMKEQKESMAKLLTEEQRKKLKDMRPRDPRKRPGRPSAPGDRPAPTDMI